MHRSRLGGLIIDCQVEDLDQAADFWSKTLGCECQYSNNPEDRDYAILKTAPNELDIEIQKVNHQSRVHIDIETDDIEAEARRLEKLGAKRVGEIKSWLVMEAPTGQRFCLVKPQRANFLDEANIWE